MSRAARWLWALPATALAAAAWLSSPAWLPALLATLSPDSIGAVSAQLRALGPLAPLASIVLMVLQSVISPLPGSLVAAANGALFGVWWGSLLSWLGGMAGAAVTYLLGRLLGERATARWSGTALQRRLERAGADHGFWIVLMARLTPVISLDFIGYLAGAARMPLGVYLAANLLGLAPGLIFYSVLGHDLVYARALTWQAGVGAILLVVLFVVGRHFFQRRPACE